MGARAIDPETQHSWQRDGRCAFCGIHAEWRGARLTCPNTYARLKTERKEKERRDREAKR